MSGAEIWDWAYKLLLAAGLGALVGVERELGGHAAGSRTQALVAMGSALLTAVGAEGFGGAAADPTRVASQVVTGIGFIGAGVILKQGGTVRGITTAATLWVSAALGVAVGVGLVIPALLGAGTALVFIYALRLMKPLVSRNARKTVQVEYDQGHGTMGPLIRSLRDLEGVIEDLDVEDLAGETGEPLRKVTVQILTHDSDELDEALRSVADRPEVRRVQVVE